MRKLELAGIDVSRETIERLEAYAVLLKKWNPKINLVSPDTLDTAWDRHINDSAQLVALSDKEHGSWVDIGSGGGFPGMVVAAILHEISPESRITLIESDQRKSTFLRTVNRELGLNVRVQTSRIEDCPASNAQIVSARALAPLPKLLGYVAHHLTTTGTALLQKGQSWEKEVVEAQGSWKFTYTAHKSVTDPSSVVLEIKDIEHV